MAKMSMKPSLEQASSNAVKTWTEKLNGPVTPKYASTTLGYTGRAAFSKTNPLAASIARQTNRANGAVSDNPMHGLALDSIATELRGRLNRTVQGSEEEWNQALTSNAHLDAALNLLQTHRVAHGTGDAERSVAYLNEAAGHINSAVNSLPDRSILKDSWTTSNTPTGVKDPTAEQVPWRITPTRGRFEGKNIGQQQGAEREASDFVSVENVHSDLSGIVGAYKAHLDDVGKSVDTVKDIPLYDRENLDRKMEQWNEGRSSSPKADDHTLSSSKFSLGLDKVATMAQIISEGPKVKATKKDAEEDKKILADQKAKDTARDKKDQAVKSKIPVIPSEEVLTQLGKYKPKKTSLKEEESPETKAADIAAETEDSSPEQGMGTAAAVDAHLTQRFPVNPEPVGAPGASFVQKSHQQTIEEMDAQDKQKADEAAARGDTVTQQHHLGRIANRAERRANPKGRRTAAFGQGTTEGKVFDV